MDKRKEANLRVKHEITKALTELMREKDYTDISVSEIVQRAGVSRVSYYRNYQNKEDILTEHLQALMDHFSSQLNELPMHTPMRRILTVFFRIAREERERFLLLCQAGMDADIEKGLEEFLLSSPHFPTLNRKRPYPAALCSGALFQLLRQWYARDTEETDTELSNLFCQYMSGLF